MPYLIGTDEAGYGPNLGPLVISVTVWHLPEQLAGADLYRTLSDSICNHPSAARNGRIAIADSKKLYSPGKGLAWLEKGLLPALGGLGTRPTGYRALCLRLDPDFLSSIKGIPWYCDFDLPIPVDADLQTIERATAVFRRSLDATGVRLIGVRSAIVTAQKFNALIREFQNKSTTLSHVTLSLLAGVMQSLGGEPAVVVCDKHGGRNRYGPLLQHHFPDSLVEVRQESRAKSTYRWGPPESRVEVSFQTGGESFMPAALASMASKYIRELSMRALNRFWQQQVDGLKPTAGYPVDARRFRAEIAAAQKAAQIDDKLIWRSR